MKMMGTGSLPCRRRPAWLTKDSVSDRSAHHARLRKVPLGNIPAEGAGNGSGVEKAACSEQLPRRTTMLTPPFPGVRAVAHFDGVPPFQRTQGLRESWIKRQFDDGEGRVHSCFRCAMEGLPTHQPCVAGWAGWHLG